MSTELDEGYKNDIDSLIQRVRGGPDLNDKDTVIEGLKALRHEIEANRMNRAAYTSCTDFDELDE